MTILFISHYSGFYGAAKSLLTLMLDLRDRYGVKPLVLLPTQGALCAELDRVGISYKVSFYYWWVNENHGLFQYLLNKRKQLINYFKISKLCCLFPDEKIELVYSNSVCVNVGMFMAQKMGVPHIWQFRESLSQFNLSLSLSLSLSLLQRPINKRYILISDYMMRYYAAYLPQDRMVRIYNGIKMPSVVRKQNSNVDQILNICMLGILCEQKNQMDALRALAILKQRGATNLRLHLIGSYKEDYLKTIEQFIHDNELSSMVKIWGHRTDIHDLLQQMNLGLMCSRDEAFGRVTVEFMANRMPVIASNSGANEELIKNNSDGFIYPIYDAEQLACHIQKFIDCPELLDSMGKTAYKTFSDNYTMEKNTDAIYRQIQNVINNK